MNEKRVEELQSSFMAFNSISELVLIVKSKNSEEEAVEAARRELKKRENIGLSELDPRIDEKEIPPYVLILSIIFSSNFDNILASSPASISLTRTNRCLILKPERRSQKFLRRIAAKPMRK